MARVVPEVPEPQPMVTPEQIRGVAMWVGIAIATLIGLLFPELFLLATVVVLAIWLIVVHSQRDEAAAETADLVFKLAAERHKNARLAADFDALVARHADVLDEHASCPAPVVVR
jgi:hypothetical protein